MSVNTAAFLNKTRTSLYTIIQQKVVNVNLSC
jgi:hypothetical protein